jgi:hypothetical protein
VAALCVIYTCSRTLLYPDKRILQTRAQANENRATKNVSVSAWFESLLRDLDPMPDEDFYQLHVPKKVMLHDMYIADCELYPTDFQKCTFGWFNHIWAENHSNVRVRRHCRFAKCNFCVKWRALMDDQTKTPHERAEARDRVNQHINWAHTRERGLYHDKIHKAVKDPGECISLAMDGTAQMGSGMPHFKQKTKRDGAGSRHKYHTQIVLVHGSAVGPYVFLGAENVAGDPNWTIDSLYRALKREEEERAEGLPEVLYLQMDNCARENKNTYLLTYCAWLVERGVFKEIFVSFLPVGHTHFDPDQLASRIAQGVKHKNVHSVASYIEVIKQCFNPVPEVVHVERVMDTKFIFNPTNDTNFHPKHAICLRTHGCCTAELKPGRSWYMEATTPLHWRMRRDGQGRAFIQAKYVRDDICWSKAFRPWSSKCPRPENRPIQLGWSGLLPSDIKMTAPTKVMQASRQVELSTALDNIRGRISDEEWADVQTIYDEVTTAAERGRLPEGFGTFDKDDLKAGDAPQPQPGILVARQHIVLESQQQQNASRKARKEQGHASEMLVINNFIAYVVNYTDETKEEDKQDFWVGRIVGIDVEQREVRIRCFHTRTKKNLDSNQASYKMWGHGDSAGAYTTIGIEHVLETFLLTGKGLIQTAKRRQIKNSLDMHRLNLQAAQQPADLAVGLDYAENPGGGGGGGGGGEGGD